MALKHFMAGAAMTLVCAAAFAAPVLPGNGSETSLQDILHGLTEGGVSSYDVNLDQAPRDAVWNQTDSGMTPVRFLMEITAGATTQTFGIYDVRNAGNYVTLFDGSSTIGDGLMFEIAGNGAVSINGASTGTTFGSQDFGFFLGRPDPLWFSQDELNNPVADQMVAFQGGKGDKLFIKGAYRSWTHGGWLLAFEDAPYEQSDKDFNDLVVLVESAQPVPEPTSLALLGLGMIGLSVARRRAKTA